MRSYPTLRAPNREPWRPAAFSDCSPAAPLAILDPMLRTLRDFLDFLRARRKLWLLPLLLLLLGVGALLTVVQGSALAPFIYTIF